MIFAAVWIIVCALAWCAAYRIRPPVRFSPALVVATAATIVRVVPALVLDRGLAYDVEAHWRVGLVTLAGLDVYTTPLTQGRYPYPPLPMLLDALMVQLAGHNYARFLLVDKLVPAAFGVALSVVVWALAHRAGHSPSKALAVGLFYALNPLAVLVTSYHGQLEEIPLLGVAVALLLLGTAQQSRGRVVASALALGLAIAYKTWPLLFLLPLVLLMRLPISVSARPHGSRAALLWGRALYIGVAATPLATALLLYGLVFGPGLRGAREAVTAMAGYRGPPAFCWGYLGIVAPCWAAFPGPLDVTARTATAFLLPLALLTAAIATWRRPRAGLALLPLVFYLFTPGWGPNYSIWVLPFLALCSVRLARWYTFGVLPVVAATYLDVLYVYMDPTFPGRSLLRPAEAALGLLAWVMVAVLVVALWRSTAPSLGVTQPTARAAPRSKRAQHRVR